MMQQSRLLDVVPVVILVDLIAFSYYIASPVQYSQWAKCENLKSQG